eukprot:9745162-Prorocentrum_lima.AAC.1
MVGEDQWPVASQGVGGLIGFKGGVETPSPPVDGDKADTAKAGQHRLENRSESRGKLAEDVRRDRV